MKHVGQPRGALNAVNGGRASPAFGSCTCAPSDHSDAPSETDSLAPDRTDGATITVLYIRENCVISPAIWRKLTPTPKWPVSDVVAKNVALTPPVKVRGVKESGSPDWEIGTSVGPTGCSAAAVLFI